MKTGTVALTSGCYEIKKCYKNYENLWNMPSIILRVPSNFSRSGMVVVLTSLAEFDNVEFDLSLLILENS